MSKAMSKEKQQTTCNITSERVGRRFGCKLVQERSHFGNDMVVVNDGK